MDQACVNELTAKYLWTIGSKLSNTCKEASRFYISCFQETLSRNNLAPRKKFKPDITYCSYCGSLWQPDNHRVRIHPALKLNKKIKKLFLLSRDKPWLLTRKDKKRLSAFKWSHNKIVYHCLVCQKASIIPGTKCPTIPEALLHSCDLSFNPEQSRKIKRKKKEVNAGLLISNEKTTKHQKINSSSTFSMEHSSTTPQNATPSHNLSNPAKCATNITPINKIESPSLFSSERSNYLTSTPNLKKSSSKKRNRHSLLCQVLEEELKRKNSENKLQSFLYSV